MAIDLQFILSMELYPNFKLYQVQGPEISLKNLPITQTQPPPFFSSSTISFNTMGRIHELNTFILDPELHTPNPVIFSDHNVSIIYDKYPKSAVHFLILPRDSELTYQSPFQILADQELVDLLNLYVEKTKIFAARYLQAVKNNKPPPTEFLIEGNEEELRPYLDRIRAGFHAVPSMANLHIHVLSIDLHSPDMKRFNHFNSFTTPFFVLFKANPLLLNDQEIFKQHEYLEICHGTPLTCHFCDQRFEKFSKLKHHLTVEYEKWKSS